MNRLLLIILVLLSQFSFAGNDSAAAKTGKWPTKYCAARIVGMSPNKIISIGYDYEFAQTLKWSEIGSFDKKAQPPIVETIQYKRVSGLRFTAKIPIINKPKIIWQVGLNYWKSNYTISTLNSPTPKHHGLGLYLGSENLTTTGINTSIYKPLNEKHFVIFQTSADLNGDYKFSNIQSLHYLKYSAIALIGRRPSDYKQWAVGFGRTYGAGQSSILPLVIFNYTAPNKKWGTEITLPARAWYRRTINKNSLLRAGYELEGASYHLNFMSTSTQNYELRRGELRTKIEYQCKLYKAFWLSAQTGYCKILNYKVDDLGTGKDFTRNITGDHNYAMINKLSDFMFFNLSINFVSL